MKTEAEIESPCPLPLGSCVAIGFMGGVDAWNDDTQGVRRAALRIRDHEGKRFAETFESRNVDLAMRFLELAGVLRPDAPPKTNEFTIVLYGQSLGGASVVRFARYLKTRQVRVTLTVQVDSVGFADRIIPPNVRYAANFYQKLGLFLRGVAGIEPADPEKTLILGNWPWREEGAQTTLPSTDPWWKVLFQRTHLRMVHDQRVWNDVYNLVVAACGAQGLEESAKKIEASWR